MSQSESAEGGSDSQELLLQEAHDVIERQLNTIEQTENKASSILRINLLIFGALLTVASLILRLDDLNSLTNLPNSIYTTWYLSVGIGALILSAISAGITYTASNIYIGASGDDLDQLSEIESYSELNRNLVAGYSYWIKMNQYTLVANNFMVTLTITLIVTGVLFLGLASLAWLLQGLLAQITIVLFGGISLVLIVKMSGLSLLYRDYRKTRSKVHETIEEYYEEVEEGGIGTLLEGSQRRNQNSEVSDMIHQGVRLEEWIAENPESVVGDTRKIASVINQPITGSDDVRYQPDVFIEYADGGAAIVEAKISNSPSNLRNGIQHLLTYEQYFEDPELYLVANEIPSLIESELEEHGIVGVNPPSDFNT